jgi:hypothetical protein
MTLKSHFMATAMTAGFRPTALERSMGRLLRDPEGHEGEGDGKREPPEGETAAQKAAREAAEAEAAGKTADAEQTAAALEAANAELEAARARLAEFEGIDAAQARENAKKVADAEKAKKEAEKAAKEAERARAQAENDVEALRRIQNEEHKAELDRIAAERDAERTRAQSVEAELTRVRTENAFNGSKFINEETILTGAKAQRLFGDYVEVEDGKVVVYDAPRGEAKRARVQDSKGNSLSFNEAIAKVINADPDKDSLLKSKTKPGAGTSTTEGKPEKPAQSRHQKLAAGLANLRKNSER